MKKSRILFAALVPVVFAVLFSSCKNEVDDIFDKSAADRMSESISSYTDLLTSNGGTWAMEYFSNSTTPGFVFLLKFESNGEVTISANYNAENRTEYDSDTSHWRVIGDNGPVLSFDTYNDVLHFFSDPNYSPRGRGFEGDYEFNLMGYENDTIKLNGKKNGANIVMYRMPETIDAADYFGKLFDMQANTTTVYFKQHRLIGSNGKEYMVRNVGTQVVSFYPRLGDEISQTVDANAIVTLDGFYFQNPVDLIDPDGGHTLKVQHFVRQEDGSFLCSDDGVSRIVSIDFPMMLNDVFYSWRVDPTNLGGRFAELYPAIDAASQAKSRRKLNNIDLIFNTTTSFNIFTLIFQTGTRQCIFGLEGFEFADETHVKFVFNGNNNSNGTALLRDVPLAQEWLDLMSGSFTMSSTSAFDSYIVRFTSDANAADYFTLKIYKRNEAEGGGDVS